MAVKIPQYQSQTDAHGFLNIGGWAQANPAPVSTAIGEGMQRFGAAVTDFGEKAREQQLEQGALDNTKWASDTRVYWTEEITKRFQQAPDGAPDFAKNVMADIDVKNQERLNTITDPRLKMHAEKQIISMRESFAKSAFELENSAKDAKKADDLEKIARNNDQLAYQGKLKPQEAEQVAKTAAANSGLNPVDRLTIAKKIFDRNNAAFLQGEIERNPNGVKQVGDALVGKHGASANENSNTFLGAAKALGLTNPNALAALGATGERESGWSPSRVGATWSDPSQSGEAGTSGGALSWRAERLSALKSFAAGKGEKGLGSMQTQAQFFMQETPALIQKLQTAKSPEEAMRLMNNAWRFAGFDKEGGETSERLKAAAAWSGKTDGVQIASNSNDIAYALTRLPAHTANSFLNQATGEASRQDTNFRVDFKAKKDDHAAMAANGVSPQQPLTMADFTRAYPSNPAQASQSYKEYQGILQLGEDIRSVKTLTPMQQQAYLAEAKPADNSPDYQIKDARYKSVAKAIDHVNKERESDPVQWAMRANIGGIKPLDMTSNEAFVSSLASRANAAKTMKDVYGVPLALLSKQEATSLTDFIAKADGDNRNGFLRSIAGVVQDKEAYKAVMQQIAEDNPAMARAGLMLQQEGTPLGTVTLDNGNQLSMRKLSTMLIHGEALLNPPKGSKVEPIHGVPDATAIRGELQHIAGGMYAENTGAESRDIEAMRAYLAAKLSGMSTKGREEAKTNVAALTREAFSAVVGSPNTSFGKTATAIPLGMTSTAFEDIAAPAYEEAMRKASMSDDFRSARLYQFIPAAGTTGLYRITSGGDLLMDRNKNPVYLDIRQGISDIMAGKKANRPALDPASPWARMDTMGNIAR